MSETVCRLCLHTITNSNSQTIGESLLKTLKLNQKISKESVMCVECTSCLQVFFKLPPRGVNKGERTLPLSDLENGIGLDPVKIEATSNLESLMKTEIKCSFCTEVYGREDLVSLNNSNENKFMVNLLEEYIPKMNLNNAEELLTCGACLETLEGVVGVILKCLKVEEKIREYIELEGTDDKGQIQLKEVQKLMLIPKVKLETESVGMDDSEGSCDQMKEENTTMAELEIKYETEISHPELNIKTDDDIKCEQIDCDITNNKSNRALYYWLILLESIDDKLKKLLPLANSQICVKLQEPFIENKINDFSRIPVVTSEAKKCKKRIKQHLLTHKITSKTRIFHCKICSFDTKNKNFWNKHLLTHKSSSQLKMFKCELCPYETTRNDNLQQHLLTHKSPSELKMFKCELCSYESKRKSYLKRHLLVHKSPSELKMFKCELCSYESKRKSYLRRHLLVHKSPSELKMFKCELCPYEAKIKDRLKKHLLIHKSPSELKMFKCELCRYEAKHKDLLKSHLLTHKSPSELKMFKCELCPFEAKFKSNLKVHLLTHKNPSELEMFKCELCSFESICKSILKRHLLAHKSPSELKMFKYELCPYEAKFTHNLKLHLLTHKNPSELEMFKCELCSYEAKRKHHLVRHLLTHKNPSNLKMFKCKLCSYIVKSKSGLKSHLSTHKSPT